MFTPAFAVTAPVTPSVPPIEVLPDALITSNAVPTSNVVPSNVKLALSSSAPLVPAITIRLSVRSLTIALGSVTSVPSVVKPDRPAITPLLL